MSCMLCRLADLIELRKLRRSREGIDVTKLQKGDAKKKMKRVREEEVEGLRKGGMRDDDDEYVQCYRVLISYSLRLAISEMEDLTVKTRRAIRSNNFTQQTNTLDVDKHMCADFFVLSSRLQVIRCSYRMTYIEENLKIRSRPREDEDAEKGPEDPQESLYRLPEKWKLEHSKPLQEGSVTTSMSMLTAIPEVDLGMEYVGLPGSFLKPARLKFICLVHV